MLHTKVHENRSTVSKDVFKLFSYMDGKPSSHETNITLRYFQFLFPKNLHTKFGQKV